MQALLPVSGRNPNGHTADEIRAALSGLSGSRRWSFRYTHLSSTNTVIKEDLDTVISCSVEQAWQADIKRTAKFTLKDTGEINFLADRIMPRARLHLPPYGAEDWVEYPLGVFLLDSPKRKAESTGLVTRDVQGYDLLKVAADDTVDQRYTVAKNANMLARAVNLLAGGTSKVVTPNTATADAAMSWDPGTTRLRIINDILGTINYNSLSFNELGQAIISPYVEPSKRTVEWTYADDDYGLLVPGGEVTLDLGSVPNKVVLVRSNPDTPLLRSIAVNTNPASPTSTVRRGRTIVMVENEQSTVGQAYMDFRAKALLIRASQIFEATEFETGFNPLHSGNDVYRLRYGPLALNSPYVELSWTMDLKPGARMKHVARRVVSV
jgi:hypothetical protein